MDKASPDRAVSKRSRILFFVAMVALTLAACEGLATLYQNYYERHLGGHGYPEGFFLADTALGYRMPANFDGHFTRDAFAHIGIRTNSDGYRDDAFAATDSTLALIGDSVIFGSGVRAEERLDGALESALERGTGADWDIWNLGVNAYGLDHYLSLLRSGLLQQRHPTRIVIGLCMNDLEHASEAWPQWASRPNTWGRVRRASSLAWLGFHVWKQVTRRSSQVGDDWPAWFEATGQRWERPEAEQRFRKRISEITEAAPSPVLFVIWPTLFELQGGQLGSTSRARVFMAQWLTDQGLDYLDPYSRFDSVGDPESLFLPADPLHFSPGGHRIAGDAIAEYYLTRRTD
jgi:lysophospholipase L1-like esterase